MLFDITHYYLLHYYHHQQHTPPLPVPYLQINVGIKDPPCKHERTTEVYGALSKERESQVKTRADQSLLAKLRSGHYVGLRAYQNRIDGVSDPTCPQCGEEEQDLEHWLTRCPATAAKNWNSSVVVLGVWIA